jgi:Tfp pilus assembly protein PilN
MKAVNLIPAEGAAARAAAGGSGIGVYVVLAVLAVAVAMVGAGALADRGLAAKQAELAQVEAQAQSAEAKALVLKPSIDEAALRKARVETIAGLLKGRFDWARTLRAVASAVPSDVDLVSLVGTVSPTSAVSGGGGGSLRAALPVPAVDLIGCARSHARVSQLVTSLRSIEGVQRVSLASSVKSEAGSLSDTDCRATSKMPQFQLTVFYDAPEGIVPAVDATAPAAAAAAPSPAPAGDTE